jgi:DNA polymerase V
MNVYKTALQNVRYVWEVCAVLPSEDVLEKQLGNGDDLLVSNPTATYFMQVVGDSMIGAGIQERDIILVDRALRPRNNAIVIARVENELTLKRLVKENGRLMLKPENPDYLPIEITSGDDFEVWGVVTSVVRTQACS